MAGLIIEDLVACTSVNATSDELILGLANSGSNTERASVQVVVTAGGSGVFNQEGRYANIETKAINYELANTDRGKLIIADAASDIAITIPAQSNTTWEDNVRVDVLRLNTGNVTFINAAGVTMRSANADTKIANQYNFAYIVRIAEDDWVLAGDLKS